MSKKQMEDWQRAAQFWSVLVLAAHNRQLLTYGVLEHATGVHKEHQGKILGLIVAYCKSRHLPKLTSIVVSKGDGLPADRVDTPGGVARKHAKVFDHNWLGPKAPSPQDFRKPGLSKG